MRLRDLLKIILIYGFFWAFIVVAYYIGEKNGRESVVCPEPKKLYGYVDKHGELVWDEFPEAAYETFYPEAVEK